MADNDLSQLSSLATQLKSASPYESVRLTNDISKIIDKAILRKREEEEAAGKETMSKEFATTMQEFLETRAKTIMEAQMEAQKAMIQEFLETQTKHIEEAIEKAIVTAKSMAESPEKPG